MHRSAEIPEVRRFKDATGLVHLHWPLLSTTVYVHCERDAQGHAIPAFMNVADLEETLEAPSCMMCLLYV